MTRNLNAEAFSKSSFVSNESSPNIELLLERLVEASEGIAGDLRRVADHIIPKPLDIIGTPYLAERLGQTTTWIADMAREGKIPKNCIVPGTGDGKPWKFFRAKIDDWIKAR